MDNLKGNVFVKILRGITTIKINKYIYKEGLGMKMMTSFLPF